jgi:hypothetical protein
VAGAIKASRQNRHRRAFDPSTWALMVASNTVSVDGLPTGLADAG